MVNTKLLVIAVAAVFVIVGLVVSDTLTAETTETTTDDMVTEQEQFAGFVKFASVDGESKDKDHDGWCDLLAFEQGISKPSGQATGPTRRRGDVIFEDIVVTKELDKASPKIAESVCKGKVYPKVDIHIQQTYMNAGRVVFYQYELTNVQVTSYVIGSEDIPTIYPIETMTLSFEEIKVTYTETDDEGNKKGNVEYSWKVEEGES